MMTDQMTTFNAKIGCCALIQVLRLRMTLDVVYFHANLMEKSYSLFFVQLYTFFIVLGCLIRLNEACLDLHLTISRYIKGSDK